MAGDAKTDREASATWARVALFGDAVAALAPRLTRGAEVYCEGRLSLGTRTGRGGAERNGVVVGLCMTRRGPGEDWEEPMGPSLYLRDHHFPEAYSRIAA